MSAKQDLEELHAITIEIKRLSESLRKLRASKQVVEQRLSEYLRKEEIPALKDRAKGVVIVLDKRVKKVYEKPKKEREREAIELLENEGISDPKSLYNRIVGIGKTSVESNVLRFNRVN